MKDEKKWRTLIRIEGVEGNFIKVVIPGFHATRVIKLNKRKFPQNIQTFIYGLKEFPFRLHARVNIGTERAPDLEFEEFEIPGGTGKREDFLHLKLPIRIKLI